MESKPLAGLVAVQELPALMEFLEETVGLANDSGWADRPFAAPAPGGSRFSDGSFGIFYAGLDLATCVAETSYHQVARLQQTSAPAMTLHFAALRCRVTAHFVDIRKGHEQLHATDNYLESRAFGMKAVRSGADGIAYRSVRRREGQCLAVFRRPCILACAMGGLVAFEWDGEILTEHGESR